MNQRSGSEEYVHVHTAYGTLAGEIVRLMLEAMDIPAILSQESAGVALGLTIGRLGEVKVLVPAHQVEEARQILQDAEEGRLDAPVFPQTASPYQEYKKNKLDADENIKEWRQNQDSGLGVE